MPLLSPRFQHRFDMFDMTSEHKERRKAHSRNPSAQSHDAAQAHSQHSEQGIHPLTSHGHTMKTTSGRRFIIRADDDASTNTSQSRQRNGQPSYSLFPRSPNIQRQTKASQGYGIASPVSPSSGQLSPVSPNGVTINVYRSKSVKSSIEERSAPKRQLIRHKPTLSAPSELGHCREGSACTYDSVLQTKYPGRQAAGHSPVIGVKPGRESTERRGHSRRNSALTSKPLPPIKQEEETTRAPATPSSLEAKATCPDQTRSPTPADLRDGIVNAAATGTDWPRKAPQASVAKPIASTAPRPCAATPGTAAKTLKCPMPGCDNVLRRGTDLCRACAREFRPRESIFYPTPAGTPKTPMSAPLMYALPEEEEEEDEEEQKEKAEKKQEERKGVVIGEEEAARFRGETDCSVDSIDRLSSRFNSQFRLQPAPPGKAAATRRGPLLTNKAQSASPRNVEGASYGTTTHGGGKSPSGPKHISFQMARSATRHPSKNHNAPSRPPADTPARPPDLRQHHDTLKRGVKEARHESKDVDEMIEKLIRLYEYQEGTETDKGRGGASRDLAHRKGAVETPTPPERDCETPEDVVEIPAIGKVRREWVSQQGVRVVSIGLVELASWSPVYHIESWI